MKTENEIQGALTLIESVNCGRKPSTAEERMITDVLRWVLEQPNTLGALLDGFRDLLEIRTEPNPTKKLKMYADLMARHSI